MTKYFLLEELSLLYERYELASKNDEIFEVKKKIRDRIKEINELISNIVSPQLNLPDAASS